MRKILFLDIEYDFIKSIIDYGPETGICTWKNRPREMFSNEQSFKAWNTKYSGKRAGNVHTNPRGYSRRTISIKNKPYYEHRIVWMYMTGEHPPEQIDHINGDATDNRWCNMKDGTEDNYTNKSKASNNTSGYTGVTWSKTNKKWSARVKRNKKYINIGYFDSVHDAAHAVRVKREEMGFSPRHGETIDYIQNKKWNE